MSSLFKKVKGKMEKVKLFTVEGGGGVSDVLEEISMPEFLKTGLAKIRTHSTTRQLSNKNEIRLKADKKAYI